MGSVRGRKCLVGCTCGRHRQTMTQCAQCGGPFIRSRSKMYCSRACAGRSYYRRLTATCLTCGETFDFAAARKTAKYCGRACAASAAMTAREQRPCMHCGEMFVAKVGGASKFCSLPCRDASMRTGAEAPCVICGATFYAVPSRVNAQFCSGRCAGLAKRMYEPGEAKRQSHRKRRAAKLAVLSERYVTAEIAERDGWRCQICKSVVPRDAKYPHPRSASVDHIVPLSQGGADVRANVQLAHLRCNVTKGARTSPAGDQLRLIG